MTEESLYYHCCKRNAWEPDPSCSTRLPADLGLTRDLPYRGEHSAVLTLFPGHPFFPEGLGVMMGSRLPRSQVAPFTYFSWLSCRLCHLSSLSFSAGGCPEVGTAGSRVRGEASQQSLSLQLCTQVSPSAGQGGLS